MRTSPAGLAHGMVDPVIHRVTTLDLAVQPWPWPWAAAERGRIAAHFAGRQQEKPGIWNGRVLLARNADFSDGRLSSVYFETDFASFLAWRDWGYPDPDIFNGFGMGALRASDGAFVLGVMGGHTVNSGRIYFAGGTPDPEDVRGDRLDIAASITREIEEETGLTPADYRVTPHWDCVVTPASVAIVGILDVDMPGEALKARIEANLAGQEHPELSGIHLVRTRADFRASMPRFVTAFLESQLDV
jgi:8-oxo-dGTP pyrophosphatase MutT (NUDIX family)